MRLQTKIRQTLNKSYIPSKMHLCNIVPCYMFNFITKNIIFGQVEKIQSISKLNYTECDILNHTKNLSVHERYTILQKNM